MRKIITILLGTFMILCLGACAETSQHEVVEECVVIEEASQTAIEEDSAIEETNESVVDQSVTAVEEDVSEQEAVLALTEKDVLVVYFSVTGNTQTVAEKIAAVTDADIYEIKPAIEYTDADIDYGDSNSRTSKEQNDSSTRPEIQSEMISLEGYNTIYIGYPIWWGQEPRIMDTFVESYDFGDITMVPFCTSGSSGIGKSGKNLAENAGSGNWLDGKRFDTKVSESELEAWISELQ